MPRICEIRSDGGVLAVDGVPCGSAGEAYLRFRALWDAAAGKVASRKMRGRARAERIQDKGTVMEDIGELEKRYEGVGKVRSWILGMIGSSYVRVFSASDMPQEYEEDWRGFLTWLMADSGRWRTCGRRAGTGRTGRNYKTFRRWKRKR